MQFLEGHNGAISALAFSPNGQSLASGDRHGFLRMWSLCGNEHTVVIANPPPSNAEAVTAVTWSSDGKSLAIGRFTDLVVYLTESQVSHVFSEFAPVSGSAFTGRNQFLIVGVGDRMEETDSGRLLFLQCGKSFDVAQDITTPAGVMCLAARDKRIVYASARRITRWDFTSPDKKTTSPHIKPIYSVALSPDGRIFAATDDYSIQLYNADTMQRLRTLGGHKGRVDSLAFTPDGRYLLSGAWDGTARLWDADSGREVVSHNWDIGNLRTVAVSPDGTLAAAGGDRGTIVLWDLDR